MSIYTNPRKYRLKERPLEVEINRDSVQANRLEGCWILQSEGTRLVRDFSGKGRNGIPILRTTMSLKRFKARERPQNFVINPEHPLGRGLVFAGLGRVPKTNKFVDSSPYGNHGVLTNMEPATDWVWDGTLNRWVLRLDAGAEVMTSAKQFPAIDAADPFSISVWWRPDAYVSLANVFGFGNTLPNTGSGGDAKKQRYLLTYNNVYYLWSGGTDWSTGIADDHDGLWHHIAVTCDGTSVCLYRHGSLVAGPAARPVWLNPFTYVSIGEGHLNAVTSANADISDGLIHNRCLTSAEIQQLADPSNVLLSGLIKSEKRKGFFTGVDIPTSPRETDIGHALSFNGSEYVSLNQSISGVLRSNYTISAWVKPSALTGKTSIIGDGTSSTGFSLNIRGDLTGDPLELEYFGITTLQSDSSGLVADKWNHIVVTWSYGETVPVGNTMYLSAGLTTSRLGGTVSGNAVYISTGLTPPATLSKVNFYVNGINVGSGTLKQLNTSVLSTYIGGLNYNGVATSCFSGLITDLRLYSKALSPQGVWNLYDPTTRFTLFRVRDKYVFPPTPYVPPVTVIPRTRLRRRPDNFRLNPEHPLGRGLVFAGLGRIPKTRRFCDSSPYGNHGVLTNMEPATDWVFDPYLGRWCCDYDGSDERCDVPSLSLSPASPCTVAFWTYMDAYAGDAAGLYYVGGLRSGDSAVAGPICYQWSINSSNRYIGLNWTGTTTLISGSTVAMPALATWTHFALTYDGSGTYAGVSIYKNGLIQAHNPVIVGAANGAGLYTNDGSVILAGRKYDTARQLNGRLADVGIWKRSLNTPEIQQLADPSNVLLSGLIEPVTQKRYYLPITPLTPEGEPIIVPAFPLSFYYNIFRRRMV